MHRENLLCTIIYQVTMYLFMMDGFNLYFRRSFQCFADCQYAQSVLLNPHSADHTSNIFFLLLSPLELLSVSSSVIRSPLPLSHNSFSSSATNLLRVVLLFKNFTASTEKLNFKWKCKNGKPTVLTQDFYVYKDII